MREQILLHVEDEDVTAGIAAEVLLKAGLRLFRVSDGEEALAFLHRTGKHHDAPRPDIILLDLGLPLRTGFEVLAEIHASTELRSLQVVVFTSSSRPSDRRKSLELGALDFITKQPSIQGMTQALQKVWAYLPANLQTL